MSSSDVSFVPGKVQIGLSLCSGVVVCFRIHLLPREQEIHWRPTTESFAQDCLFVIFLIALLACPHPAVRRPRGEVVHVHGELADRTIYNGFPMVYGILVSLLGPQMGRQLDSVSSSGGKCSGSECFEHFSVLSFFIDYNPPIRQSLYRGSAPDLITK